jgi:AbrB family looped-hinge helix DNA binding protein
MGGKAGKVTPFTLDRFISLLYNNLRIHEIRKLLPKGAITMPVVKILRHGQITLPKEIRKILGVDEGDFLEIGLENTKVFLQPKVLVDKQTILAKTGVIKIEEALEALKKKEIKEFDNVNDLINELNS